MIDIDNWMRELEEEEDIEIKNNEEYQTKLFEEYVLRGSDHQEERRKLNERYLSGEELMGEHGLRKELAAFDMSYFGRAYLPHYFIRKSPHFHEELDEIWSRGVMKGRNPLKEAKVISRLKGSRQVVAAPRGHAKSTNFTFKDSLHAILYAYKHYILILSDSSEQAEGFLDDIKTELEDNAKIIMDFGSLKGDKAWRTGVILTKTDIKAEAIGSGKKVRGRRHRNWRPALSTKTGYMYVVDASVEKRKPDVIIEDVFEMNRRLKRDCKKGFYKFGVEVVQFQYFFKEVMAAKSAEEGEYIPIEEIQSTVNKVLRIESLQPVIKNKYLKFNREHKTLLKQLQEFPMGKNDDAPDGLQMAVQLAQTVKAVASKANYKTVLRRRFRMGKGAY